MLYAQICHIVDNESISFFVESYALESNGLGVRNGCFDYVVYLGYAQCYWWVGGDGCCVWPMKYIDTLSNRCCDLGGSPLRSPCLRNNSRSRSLSKSSAYLMGESLARMVAEISQNSRSSPLKSLFIGEQAVASSLEKEREREKGQISRIYSTTDFGVFSYTTEMVMEVKDAGFQFVHNEV